MKFHFIQENCTTWPERVICAVLAVSASGYYAWRNRSESRRTTANRHLLGEIRRIHLDSSGTYGSPRIHAVLGRTGHFVGRSRIEALMHRAGLRGVTALPRRVRTTDSRHRYPIAPNRLARNFRAQRPNRVGFPTSRISLREKVGFTSQPSSMPALEKSSAGPYATPCIRKLHWMHWPWLLSGNVLGLGSSIIRNIRNEGFSIRSKSIVRHWLKRTSRHR